jgi:hypothetical protein
LPALGLGGRAIENDQVMTGRCQVPCHGITHNAEADEAQPLWFGNGFFVRHETPICYE